MLRKIFRITPRSRVEYVLRKGFRARGRFFQLRVLPRRISDAPHFAVIVSKKVDAGAVVRNTIKRRFHEAIRQNWPQIAGVWYDVAVLVSSSAKDAPYAALKQDLLLCLKKLSTAKN